MGVGGKMTHPNDDDSFFLIFIYYLLIYLAAPGLSCRTRALLVAACMWDLVPRPGMEPGPPPLHRQRGVLTTGPPEKSLMMTILVTQEGSGARRILNPS